MDQRMESLISLVGKSNQPSLVGSTGKFLFFRTKNSGSFIRPSANIQYGVSFLEALTSKYIEALHGSETQEKVLLGSSAGAIEVEAVSLDKIRQKFARVDHLREVSLDNMGVVRGDAPGSISQTCPSELLTF